MLEAALKTLFDYQRFERNPALQGVIDETMDRYARRGLLSLGDEILEAAAGGVRSLEEEPQESDYDGN